MPDSALSPHQINGWVSMHCQKHQFASQVLPHLGLTCQLVDLAIRYKHNYLAA